MEPSREIKNCSALAGMVQEAYQQLVSAVATADYWAKECGKAQEEVRALRARIAELEAGGAAC